MTDKEKEIARNILNKTLWGVHKPILKQHYSFEERILQAMNEYKNA